MVVGRFAPSPSGRMHLGNVFSALLAWLSVRSAGGKMILRIEDLDPDRCRPEYAAQLRRDLEWLGLDWDEEQTPQSQRTEAYAEAFARLDTYPCYCSRNELHAASAPHASDGAVIYAGTCRDLTAAERAAKTRRPAWRVRVPDEEVSFVDGLQGEVRENLARECGDFILRRSDGVYAYQLAVVVDDAAGGVTEIVRGAAAALAANAARPAASALVPCAAALRAGRTQALEARARSRSRRAAPNADSRAAFGQAGVSGGIIGQAGGGQRGRADAGIRLDARFYQKYFCKFGIFPPVGFANKRTLC